MEITKSSPRYLSKGIQIQECKTKKMLNDVFMDLIKFQSLKRLLDQR